MKSTTKQVPTLRNVKPINFLFYRTETTIAELNKFMWVASELFQEAVINRLRITGPIHWHYFGFMGDASKPFTLEISLPVAEVLPDYDGKFHFKRTEEFKCVSLRHEGNWLEIPSSYEKLMKFLQKESLQPVAVNREIYVNADFNFPEANSTEIQVGIV
jgi:effector-binding domain-containing protein